MSGQCDATLTESFWGKFGSFLGEFSVDEEQRTHPIQLSGEMLLCVWDIYVVLSHSAVRIAQVLLS